MNKAAVIIGLLAGSFLLIYWGGTAPAWLLKLECVAVMAAALLFGFFNYSASAPEWLRHDAVRGVAVVYLGIGAMFIDPRVLISSFLIGTGCKLVMKAAWEPITAHVAAGRLATGSKEIVIRPEGGVSRR